MAPLEMTIFERGFNVSGSFWAYTGKIITQKSLRQALLAYYNTISYLVQLGAKSPKELQVQRAQRKGYFTKKKFN